MIHQESRISQKEENLFALSDFKKSLEEDEDDREAKEERERAKFNDKTFFGKLARHKHFEYITLGVIVFNALYLGYDCDYNARWGKPDDLYESSLWGFILLDNFFCGYFTLELLIRFFGYKSKLYCCRDFAFLFDLFLVLLMIIETWVLAFIGTIDFLKQVSILRLLRLARLLRMGKIMRYFPELQLIVKGMLAAVRSVGCATILLLLVLYVFAIIFTNEYHQGLKTDDDEDMSGEEVLFGSLGKSMRHLLIMSTILDDITACTNTIRTSGKIHMLLAFILCVLVSSFTLFNMLLGILCEVVEATQNFEQEKAEAQALNSTIRSFFATMDLDHDGVITHTEFLRMRSDVDIMDKLAALQIEHEEFKKYAELLFMPDVDGKRPTLELADVTKMISRLRPGQDITALDFKHFGYEMKQNNKEINKYIAAMEKVLDEWDHAAKQRSVNLRSIADISDLPVIPDLPAINGSASSSALSLSRQKGARTWARPRGDVAFGLYEVADHQWEEDVICM